MIRQIASNFFRRTTNFTQPITSLRFNSNYESNNCEDLLVEPRDQVLWVKFNRPKKFNAITNDMYRNMTDVFTKVNSDKSIKTVILAATGEYYSSGNDLYNFVKAIQAAEGDARKGLTGARNVLEKFIASLIDAEKLMVAAVNGPAIGLAVTTLPLFDYVIASDKSTFSSPFTSLGMCPEACSSYTLPKIMGLAKSTELLLLNKTWDASKAERFGLVSEVVEHAQFRAEVEKKLAAITKTCYPNALYVSKSLIHSTEYKKVLHKVNKQECDAILELWLGEECNDAIQKFAKRSKK